VDSLIAVLAGGQGERVGGAKPWLALGGRPLIHYPVSAGLEAGADVLVVAKPDTALPPLEAPVLREPEEPRHPLCGIVAALREVDGRAAIIVGCDLPFVTAELLGWLGGLPEPFAVPVLDGRLHPLLARYGPGLLAPLERALDGRRPLQEAVRELGPRLIHEEELGRFGEPRRLLFNLNTPEDLVRAEAILAAAR
jgi:molybdopterin-guanine dinucleotide biosynthesis protein A